MPPPLVSLSERKWSPAFWIFTAAVLAVVSLWIPEGFATALGTPIETVLWIAFISAAGIMTVPMLPRVQVDASLGAPVCVAAAVVLDPSFAALVALLGITSERELHRGVPLDSLVFNHAQMALSTGTAATVAAWAPIGFVPSTLAAVITFNMVNIVAITGSLWLRKRLDLQRAAKGAANPFPRFLVNFLFVSSLALLIVVAYESVGVWGVGLLAFPLWLGYSALSSARQSEDRAEELAMRVRELETLNRLSEQLVSVRRRYEVAETTVLALEEALGTEQVGVSFDGDIDPSLDVVKLRGSEPAAVGIPHDRTERSVEVVEAIAGLAGMALQRLHLEQELAENEKARARLSERILEEATHERSRIALEIHDDVLPYLAAAAIQADNVRTAIDSGDAARAHQLTDVVHNAAHDGIARLREVLDKLRHRILVPGELRDGLQAALDDLDLRHGVTGKLHAPDPLPGLPLAVEILVLETVRGCLANVARHAQAETLELTVDFADGTIQVEVQDDGRGFDPDAVDSGHHGLILMAQRVELARGRLHVDSAPGRGTTVRMEVPL